MTYPIPTVIIVYIYGQDMDEINYLKAHTTFRHDYTSRTVSKELNLSGIMYLYTIQR